jgi:hypothetical protein
VLGRFFIFLPSFFLKENSEYDELINHIFRTDSLLAK